MINTLQLHQKLLRKEAGQQMKIIKEKSDTFKVFLITLSEHI